jgi:hypothetical protein
VKQLAEHNKECTTVECQYHGMSGGGGRGAGFELFCAPDDGGCNPFATRTFLVSGGGGGGAGMSSPELAKPLQAGGGGGAGTTANTAGFDAGAGKGTDGSLDEDHTGRRKWARAAEQLRQQLVK